MGALKFENKWRKSWFSVHRNRIVKPLARLRKGRVVKIKSGKERKGHFIAEIICTQHF